MFESLKCTATWSTKTENNIAEGSVLVEMNRRFVALSLNVILRMVAGKRFFAGDENMSDEREALRVHEPVRKFFKLSGTFVVGDAIPYIRWLDLGGYEKAMKKTAKELDDIIGEWLEEHKRNRSSASEAKEKQDLMDVMLSVLQAGSDLVGHHPDTINKATILVSIFLFNLFFNCLKGS